MAGPDGSVGPDDLATPALAGTQTGIDVGRRLAPGTLVAGRHRIHKLLGLGGMGLVYQAHDETLDIDVALKVLRPDLGADPEWAARFRRELLLAREVTHRNVVRIHDIGEHEGLLYITMQLVTGRSLAAVLAADGRLEVPRAAEIGRQMAEALQPAHDAGIVHRDLKPANILLSDDGTAYLTDFGVARSFTGGGMTRAGAVVGTPDYLSPEQIAGDPVDGRADIYALGIVLYEMITGELPFRGGTQAEQLAQRLTGQVRRVADTGVRAPEWLEQVIRHCLQRDPGRRPSSAREVAAALASRQGAHARWSPSRRLAGGVVAGVLLAAAAGWMAMRSSVPPVATTVPATADSRATAVLPFVDETSDPALAFAGRAVAEMLSAQLAEDPAIRVVDAVRVERTLDDLRLRPGPSEHAALRRVASLLEVDRLVTGSLRRAGSTVRLDARLLEVSAAGEVAVTALSSEAQGDAQLFDAVSRLGADLRSHLHGDGAPVEPGEPETSSVDAARAHREGLDALARGDAAAARTALERAVEADPSYAAALDRLAEAYQSTGQMTKALDAARRAAAAAPATSRRGIRARARLEMLEGRPAEAARLFGELARLYPRDVEALLDLAAAESAQGDVGRAVLTLRRATEVDRREPRAWFLLGKNEILAGDATRAVKEDLLQALTLQTQLQDEAGRADVLNALGVGWHQLGDYSRALDNYSQAAEVRARLRDERGTAISLKNRGRVLVAMGRFADAEPDLVRARGVFATLGDEAAVAGVLDDLGLLHEGRGDYAAARVAYQEALALRRDQGDERQLAQSFDNVGYILFLQGDYDGAGVYWQQALGLRTRLGDKGGEILSRQNLGFLQTAQGRWGQAVKTFVATLEDARRIEFKNAAAVAHGNLGILYQLEGRPRAAQQSFEQALASFRELDDARGEAEFTIKQGAALLEMGQREAAAPVLDRAEELLKRVKNREQAADLLLARSVAARLAGNEVEARKALAEAVVEARASHGRVALLRAQVAQAAAEAEAGTAEAGRLEALRSEARGLGDMLLSMRTTEAMARAALGAGRAGDAERLLDGLVREASRAGWAMGLLNAHAARAQARERAGRAQEARSDWDKAAAVAARLEGEMDEAARAAWNTLPIARAIAAGQARQ